jgi:hypothetical protein
MLPRGDVLILGGDLAYPNPSTETYALRFVGPFEQALPPPPVRLLYIYILNPRCTAVILCSGVAQVKQPKSLGVKRRDVLLQGVHPGRLVVNKPDLAPVADGRLPEACLSPPSCCAAHADFGRSSHSGTSACRCDTRHSISHATPRNDEAHAEVPHPDVFAMHTCRTATDGRGVCAC